MNPFLTTQHGVLFQGDCLKVLPEIHAESVDCVFADPPFNLGKNYKNGFNDRVSETDYLIWCNNWILECARILKPGGSFFIYALPELAVRVAGILGTRLVFRHWIALTMKGTFPRGRKLYEHLPHFYGRRMANCHRRSDHPGP